jgi:hypothetical protein
MEVLQIRLRLLFDNDLHVETYANLPSKPGYIKKLMMTERLGVQILVWHQDEHCVRARVRKASNAVQKEFIT